jgi:uncharacterized repeat protein (TIGR03803 family)
MKKLRTSGLCSLLPAQIRRWQHGKLNLTKIACTIFVFCVAAAIATSAQTFKTLATFDGTNGGGAGRGSLVQGFDGNFYGTTRGGGTSGFGTVFEFTPEGKLTSLHSFDGADGEAPYGGVLQATNGNFYGTTLTAGTSGFGTVFEITPEGKLSTLHSFDNTDGGGPFAGLIQATNGNFYGTTGGGGTSGFGTVFEITPEGKVTTLHSFDGFDGVTLSRAWFKPPTGTSTVQST